MITNLQRQLSATTATSRAVVIIAMLALPASAPATSGWDHYTVEVAGGFEISGDMGSFWSVRQMPDEVLIWDGVEPKDDWLVAYFDTQDHLFLCSTRKGLPVLAPTYEGLDWSSPFPFESAGIWIVEKENGQLLGPFDRLALADFCDEHQISFGTWKTAWELGQEASDDRWPFALFLGVLFLMASPSFWMVVLLLGISAVALVSFWRGTRAHGAE